MTRPRSGIGRSARPWIVVLAIAIAGLSTTTALGQTGSPVEPGVATSPPEVPRVIARGPFGSVPGLAIAADGPLPDVGLLDALDAWGRGAWVRFTTNDVPIQDWRVAVTPEPALDPATTVELGNGTEDTTAEIQLPTTGLYLLRLDATLGEPGGPATTRSEGSWVWRVAVPDRDVPGVGDPYPPMPAIMLSSGDADVALDQGSGCYVGTCGDIGATSPPSTMPTIRTLAGTPLTVRLLDGSGVASWDVDASTIGATDGTPVPLASGAGPSDRLTIAAPPPGRWVILVHVRFDRDRGHADGYGRLILRSSGR